MPANTTTFMDTDGSIVCVLHQTKIATLAPDKSHVRLFTGGFNTPTTLRRMNSCLHAWGFSSRVCKDNFINTDTRIVYPDA
jgi:hypothetical protein